MGQFIENVDFTKYFYVNFWWWFDHKNIIIKILKWYEGAVCKFYWIRMLCSIIFILIKKGFWNLHNDQTVVYAVNS